MFGPSPIQAIKRKHVKAYRDGMAERRGAANQSVSVMQSIMAWAIDADLIEVNPANSIKKLKGGEYKPWPDPLIVRFFKEAPKELVWAVAMGFFTSQRKGDCLKAGWRDIENGGIHFTQEKTGNEVWVPILPEFDAILKTMPRRALKILTTKAGRPWTKSNFDRHFKKCLADMGISGYVFHGLRKNRTKILAEAGCSTEETKSWTGHDSDAAAAHYSKGANQKRLANAAMAKMLNSAK